MMTSDAMTGIVKRPSRRMIRLRNRFPRMPKSGNRDITVPATAGEPSPYASKKIDTPETAIGYTVPMIRSCVTA